MRTRVFGIGFHKTGTSTLGHALFSVGYRVAGWERVGGLLDGAPSREAEAERLWARFRPRLDDHDAAQDTPWFMFYRRLDEEFPGSRFVLTVREPARWLRSVVGHFGRHSDPMHQWIYGVGDVSRAEESHLLETYERHNREVRSHFSGRDGDLLVIDLTAGEGWDQLAPFLGIPKPPFPMSSLNPAAERNEARRALDKVRDLVAPFVGGKTRYQAALSLYYATFDALARLASAPESPERDRVLVDLLRATDRDLEDLRSTLGLPALAPAPPGAAPPVAWRRQDTVIRNTVGAVTYANVRRVSPRSRRRVEELARGLLDAAAAAGDELGTPAAASTLEPGPDLR